MLVKRLHSLRASVRRKLDLQRIDSPPSKLEEFFPLETVLTNQQAAFQFLDGTYQFAVWLGYSLRIAFVAL